MPKIPARRWQGIAVEMFADAKSRGLQGRAALRRERRIGNRKRQHDRNDMDGGGNAAEERYHGVCLFVSRKAIRQRQNRLVFHLCRHRKRWGITCVFPVQPWGSSLLSVPI